MSMELMNPSDVEVMQDELQADQRERYAKLAVFTDGKPWNANRFKKDAIDHFTKHALHGVQGGKILLVLKEMLPHGEFEKFLREELTIDPRTARNYMALALRFSGFDPELIEEIGLTKLYSMLKAPAQEIKQLESGGEFLNLEKDELIAIPAKELAARIKDANAKLRFDLDKEKVKSEELFLKSQELQKDKDRLQKELLEAKAGAPPEIPLPEFYHEVNNAAGALMALAIKLAAHAPDHADEHMATFCAQALARLEHEFNHCRKYLFNGVVDPVQLAEAGREKVAQLKNDSRFDFSKLND